MNMIKAMTPEQLITDNLDIWTQAIKPKSSAGRGNGINGKVELYGIKKLRELILELAVRGLLVPQDPNDEPASELLKRIATEKATLIKEGKLKAQKKPALISDEEKHFAIPSGWSWARVTECYDVRDGTHDTPKYIADGYPLVTSKNLSSGKLDFSDIKFISETDHRKIIERSRVNKGDVLFAMIGSIGNPVIVCTDREFSIKNVGLFKYYSESLAVPNFLLIFLMFAERIFKNQASGAVQSFVSLGKIRSFPIALPPLAEQHRIVKKVDELMALCDQLEKQTEASLAAHQTLVETLLNTLTNAPDNAAFEAAWQRIAEHFDSLFTTEHSIDQLKQTILQLAVMGKLVPQDPNDEPASELLKKIAAEKAKLIKEGKIKKQKSVIEFEGCNSLFKELPDNWEWIQLNDIADIVRGGSPRPAGDPKFYGGSIPFLKVADITRSTSKFVHDYEYTIKEAGLSKTRYINQRVVLLTNSGATLGIPAICDFPATFNDGIAAFVELSDFVNDEYLYIYLKSISQWFINIASRGQGQPNLNTDIIKATWFSLPPINEQSRIVKKVDVLMTLCDQIKARFKDAQTSQLHLADATVEKGLI